MKIRLLLAICAIALAWTRPALAAEGGSTKTPPGKPEVKRTVFAAPFDNETEQKQYDPAAAGLADLVAVLLAEQENILVVERQRLGMLTAEQANSLKGLTGKEYSIQAGKLLRADTVLTGRLFLIANKLTVSVKALDIETSRVVAADQISCRPTYLLEAALQMARQLGKQMKLPLPEIDMKKIDKSPIASLHFAKALSHYYAGNMDAAIMQFMRTMDLDPDYVEAHYWSGMAYQRLGEWPHAAIEWRKFLAREPKSKHAPAIRKLLAEAALREKDSNVKRLGPPGDKPKTKPDKPAPKTGTTRKSDKPGPATRPSAAKDAENKAAAVLKMARLYDANGLLDAATMRYRQIVKEYPNTKAAAVARERIEALKK